MVDNYIRMDLALIENRKGTLMLDFKGLTFTCRKGLNFSIPLSDIENVSFVKTSLKTSTLIVNEMEITVCRAHLWAADIKKLGKKNLK